jgi:hypothetical protein
MVAANIANLDWGGDWKSADIKGPIGTLITIEDAADLLNVSQPSVKRARAVKRHGTPELAQADQHAHNVLPIITRCADTVVQRLLLREAP